QLVDHLTTGLGAAPAGVAPREGAGIDDLRGTVHAFRLETRGGVGQSELAVEPVVIAGARRRRGDAPGEIAVSLALQTHDVARDRDDLQRPGVRCPYAEVRAPGGTRLG